MKERLKALTGDDLRRLLAEATRCLEQNTDAINALNVFPVPDGDTGINMLLTMRSVQEHLAGLEANASTAKVAQLAARGALLGARGNSGVILSQFLQGFSEALQDGRQCTAQDLARGFQAGAKSAYKAVGKPVEGTMLTVLRQAAEAMALSQNDRADITTLWDAACQAAKESLARTPEQLPILREAGVVDAGGQGIVALLEGAKAFLHGEPPAELAIATSTNGRPPVIRQEFLAATHDQRYGYCTQLLIRGQGLDVDAIRDRMATMADSAVVVGDSTLLKVHIHTPNPDPIVGYARTLGALDQVNIQNIDEQHQEFLAAHRRQTLPLAVIAVAWGAGLEKVFRNLGAAAVVSCGETMNPSTQELLQAVNRVNANELVLLPNNPNVIAAAKQAAKLASKPAHVLPTRSLPQGIAAMLAFNPERDVRINLETMSHVLQEVRTAYITTAVRDTVNNGLKVRQGQFIGLLEESLVATGSGLISAITKILTKTKVGKDNLVTLYWGAPVTEEEAKAVRESLGDSLPLAEVELVYGGQPHYHFIVSIE